MSVAAHTAPVLLELVNSIVYGDEPLDAYVILPVAAAKAEFYVDGSLHVSFANLSPGRNGPLRVEATPSVFGVGLHDIEVRCYDDAGALIGASGSGRFLVVQIPSGANYWKFQDENGVDLAGNIVYIDIKNGLHRVAVGDYWMTLYKLDYGTADVEIYYEVSKSKEGKFYYYLFREKDITSSQVVRLSPVERAFVDVVVELGTVANVVKLTDTVVQLHWHVPGLGWLLENLGISRPAPAEWLAAHIVNLSVNKWGLPLYAYEVTGTTLTLTYMVTPGDAAVADKLLAAVLVALIVALLINVAGVVVRELRLRSEAEAVKARYAAQEAFWEAWRAAVDAVQQDTTLSTTDKKNLKQQLIGLARSFAASTQTPLEKPAPPTPLEQITSMIMGILPVFIIMMMLVMVARLARPSW